MGIPANEAGARDEERLRILLEDVSVRDTYVKRRRGTLSREFTRCFDMLSATLDGHTGEPLEHPTYREVLLRALRRTAARIDGSQTRSASGRDGIAAQQPRTTLAA